MSDNIKHISAKREQDIGQRNKLNRSVLYEKRCIVDFYCSKAKLIIELDGGQHTFEEAILYDQERTAFLNSCGYKVIRFWNDDAIKNIEGVLTVIGEELAIIPLSPTLSHKGRGRKA